MQEVLRAAVENCVKADSVEKIKPVQIRMIERYGELPSNAANCVFLNESQSRQEKVLQFLKLNYCKNYFPEYFNIRFIFLMTSSVPS